MYKIFISGPMSGYDNFNKEAFIQAEQIIDRYFAVEHEIVNPARFVFPEGFSKNKKQGIPSPLGDGRNCDNERW